MKKISTGANEMPFLFLPLLIMSLIILALFLFFLVHKQRLELHFLDVGRYELCSYVDMPFLMCSIIVLYRHFKFTSFQGLVLDFSWHLILHLHLSIGLIIMDGNLVFYNL